MRYSAYICFIGLLVLTSCFSNGNTETIEQIEGYLKQAGDSYANPKESLPLAHKGFELAKSINNDFYTAKAAHFIFFIHYTAGNQGDAYQYIYLACEKYKTTGKGVEYARALVDLGTARRNGGLVEQALQTQLKALEVLGNASDNENLRFNIYKSIIINQVDLGLTSEALESVNTFRELATTDAQVISVLLAAANAQQDYGLFEEAERNYLQGLAQIDPSSRLLSLFHYNLGNLYFKQQKLDSARPYLEKAWKETMGTPQGRINFAVGLARYYTEGINRHDLAMQIINEAIPLLENERLIVSKSNLLELGMNIAAGQGDIQTQARMGELLTQHCSAKAIREEAQLEENAIAEIQAAHIAAEADAKRDLEAQMSTSQRLNFFLIAILVLLSVIWVIATQRRNLQNQREAMGAQDTTIRLRTKQLEVQKSELETTKEALQERNKLLKQIMDITKNTEEKLKAKRN